MKRYDVRKDAGDRPAVEYPGSSMTIPGLAPDLKSLLAAAANGEPLTPVGEPVFDFHEEVNLDTGEFIKKASEQEEEAARVRVTVNDTPTADLLDLEYQMARSTKPDDGQVQTDPTVVEPVVADVPDAE